MDNQELIKKILEFRAKHNITEANFARICKVSTATIYRLKCGKSIGSFTEEKIRQIIGDKK